MEITSDQTLLLIPFGQKDELHLVIESTTADNYTLISYNLADSYLHRHSQEINPANKIMLSTATSKLFCFNNKVSLLTVKLKPTLYHLETDADLATWKPIPQSSFAANETMYDIENCTVFSHKTELTVACIMNDRIIFHTFFKTAARKKWFSSSASLPQVHGYSTTYRIQSCIVVSNFIYCCLLLHGATMSIRICKFSTRLLQQNQKSSLNIRPLYIWHLKDDTLINCFLSVHKGEIMLICCTIVNNRTMVEIKRPKANSAIVSTTEYKYEFPYIVNVISTSVISCCESLTIAIVYHDDKTNKHFIKQVDMSSHICTFNPSITDSTSKVAK